jgi:hypothetical protein
MLARITDQAKLRTTLQSETFKDRNGQILTGLDTNPSEKFEFTAVIVDDYLIVGKTDNVRTCVLALRDKQAANSTSLPTQPDSSAAIVTYSNDEARVKNFIAVIAQSKGLTLSTEQTTKLGEATKPVEFSSTETSLNGNAIERKTDSAFGVFSTLLSLVQTTNTASPLR